MDKGQYSKQIYDGSEILERNQPNCVHVDSRDLYPQQQNMNLMPQTVSSKADGLKLGLELEELRDKNKKLQASLVKEVLDKNELREKYEKLEFMVRFFRLENDSLKKELAGNNQKQS